MADIMDCDCIMWGAMCVTTEGDGDVDVCCCGVYACVRVGLGGADHVTLQR